MSWNPDTYLRFAEERERPLHELIARLPEMRVRHAADLGCGPGNSTAAIKARFPVAHVTGVDNSGEMLATARADHPDGTWIQADLATWRPEAPLDLIFSNAAFHWVDDHDALFAHLFSCLKDGGALAFQVPRNFKSDSHTCLYHTADDPRWADRLNSAKLYPPMEPIQEVYDRVARHARHIDIWQTLYAHVLEGDDAVFNWVSGSALTAFLPLLADDAERDAFCDLYKSRLREAYPQRPDGKTIFPFTRLFCVAVR